MALLTKFSAPPYQIFSLGTRDFIIGGGGGTSKTGIRNFVVHYIILFLNYTLNFFCIIWMLGNRTYSLIYLFVKVSFNRFLIYSDHESGLCFQISWFPDSFSLVYNYIIHIIWTKIYELSKNYFFSVPCTQYFNIIYELHKK